MGTKRSMHCTKRMATTSVRFFSNRLSPRSVTRTVQLLRVPCRTLSVQNVFCFLIVPIIMVWFPQRIMRTVPSFRNTDSGLIITEATRVGLPIRMQKILSTIRVENSVTQLSLWDGCVSYQITPPHRQHHALIKHSV